MRVREQTIILIMGSIIIAAGFMILSQRNRIISLDEKYNLLEAQYDSIYLSQMEARQRLESEIVYETLKIALIEEMIPTFNLLTCNTSTVVLSTELIENVTVSRQIGGYKLLLLSPEEIEAKAETEGVFLYLLFTKFEPNPEHAIVNIQTVGIFDSVGGIGLGFKITGTIYQTWIS